MISQLLAATAILGALTGATAVQPGVQPASPPPPYCADSDPGDLMNGVNCDNDPPSTAGETPDPRPSNPPPGGGNPGGGGPGGGGPGGGGPGGGGGDH